MKRPVFNMRLGEEDRARLEKLAVHYAAPAATVVRMLIRDRADQVTRVWTTVPICPKAKQIVGWRLLVKFHDEESFLYVATSQCRTTPRREHAMVYPTLREASAAAREWHKATFETRLLRVTRRPR